MTTPPTAAAPSSSGNGPAGTPRPRTTARVVSLATIALGVAVIAGTLGSTAVTAASSFSLDRSSRDAAVAGVTEIDADVAHGGLSVVFDDVDRARLDVQREGEGAAWTLRRDGDTLEVSSPDSPWFGGRARGSSATLVLPNELADGVLSGRFDVGAGVLGLDGDWAVLEIDLAGGRVTFDGAAREIDLTVAGGSARADVTGADEARFELAGGELTALLRGDAPTRTEVEVTAGSADVTLPDEEYRVSTDAEMGSLDNRLRSGAGSDGPLVDVTATFGSVVLRPAT